MKRITKLEELEASRRYWEKHGSDPDFKIVMLASLDEMIDEEKQRLEEEKQKAKPA